jgi:hypothetical protein
VVQGEIRRTGRPTTEERTMSEQAPEGTTPEDEAVGEAQHDTTYAEVAAVLHHEPDEHAEGTA